MSTSGKILIGLGVILIVGAVIVALSLSIVAYRQSSDATENIVNMPPPDGVPGATGQTGALDPKDPLDPLVVYISILVGLHHEREITF